MPQRVGAAWLAIFVVLPLLGTLAAPAPPVPLVGPFGDFALRDPAEPTKPGPPDFYTASGPNPGWQIGQWNIPGGRLSPFLASRLGEVEILTSTSPEATVRIIRAPGRRAIELIQDGAVLPCTDANGDYRESDLLFGPKDRSAAGANALTTGVTPLGRLRSLVLTMVVSVRWGMTTLPKGCTVNQGAALASIVLNNLSMHPPQTLFYNVSVNPPCGPGPAARVRLCVGGTKAPIFYFKHNPFGVADQLPLLGQPYLKQGEFRTITLDLLPRLQQLIASSPEEMDHDPSHWVVDNIYAGQHIWGDFTLMSLWERFQVVAQPK